MQNSNKKRNLQARVDSELFNNFMEVKRFQDRSWRSIIEHLMRVEISKYQNSSPSNSWRSNYEEF